MRWTACKRSACNFYQQQFTIHANATAIEWSVLSKDHQNSRNYNIWHIALDALRKLCASVYECVRLFVFFLSSCQSLCAAQWMHQMNPATKLLQGRSEWSIAACSQQNEQQWTAGQKKTNANRKKKLEHYCFQQYPNNIWVFTSVHVSLAYKYSHFLFVVLHFIALFLVWPFFFFHLQFNCLQLCKIVGFLCAEFVLLQMLCSAFFYQCN